VRLLGFGAKPPYRPITKVLTKNIESARIERNAKLFLDRSSDLMAIAKNNAAQSIPMGLASEPKKTMASKYSNFHRLYMARQQNVNRNRCKESVRSATTQRKTVELELMNRNIIAIAILVRLSLLNFSSVKPKNKYEIAGITSIPCLPRSKKNGTLKTG
jgi:hypothetical protein